MEDRERQIFWCYLTSILYWGIAGALAIIVAVFAELEWECRRLNRGCYDGQGGIVLVVLVPMVSVAGGSLGGLWTFIRSKVPATSLLALEYSGPKNVQSRILHVGMPIGVWCLICLGLFESLIYLNNL